jgi:hypothetical protein
MTAGQAVPEGYENADDGGTDVPSSGFGLGGAILVRRPATMRTQLRAGLRLGYSQGRALFDLSEVCDGNDCPAQGSLRGSAAFAHGLVGGEAHLGNADKVRPYFLGELGFGAAQLWPRAKANENDALTCAVSTACTFESTGTTGTTDTTGTDAGAAGDDAETRRIAVGPAAVVGLGVAVPTVPLRVEASYVWHSLLGGAWSREGDSPGTSLSMVELSVGYLFGGG